MMRSVVLFIHVTGMLLLFIGFAVEWLSLESLRRAKTLEHASSWLRLQRVLPHVNGIALGVLLVSGIFLAGRIGAFKLAWPRLAFGLIVLMGILRGPGVRSRVRAMRDAAGQGGEVGFNALNRHASHPWLRASLVMRAALGLAAVYLMIAKPLLSASLIVTGVAVAVGVTVSLLSTAANRRPSDSAQDAIQPMNPEVTGEQASKA
ncbi:MAG TPA: hypothetical protein VGX68_00265 [Thermoanaerobaculia bacterium]|jgi:hypothetical protein|nr:hypothetical protein [Thermoanaerobaculia bacterium]